MAFGLGFLAVLIIASILIGTTAYAVKLMIEERKQKALQDPSRTDPFYERKQEVSEMEEYVDYLYTRINQSTTHTERETYEGYLQATLYRLNVEKSRLDEDLRLHRMEEAGQKYKELT